MAITGNTIDTNPLAKLAQRAGPELTATIRKASHKTGVDFSYMMEKAAAESNFNIDAQARTSSARGMYQFIESTWLQMVSRYGERNGIGDYAAQISDKGKVADPVMRREILALRDDPEIASLMAGEFAAENKRSLVRSGIPAEDIGPTELYLAHFLGAGAASQFLKGMKENPLTRAADIFPKAAAANKNVFYDRKTQAARSFGEIHAFFDKKFGGSKQSDGVTKTLVADPLLAENDKQTPKSLPGAIAAYTGLRIDQSARYAENLHHNRQMEQISTDRAAWMAGNYFDSDNDNGLFKLGRRQALAGSGLPTLPNTKSLISDPVALMLLANLDLRGVPEKPSQKDRQDNDRQTTNQHANASSKALDDCTITPFH